MVTKRVLITGFSPFGKLRENASWKGVECMNREKIEKDYNISLFQEEIDVVYSSVDETLPKLWAKLQPDLTIHVGVKNNIQHFLLETQACKTGYKYKDEHDALPEGPKHSSDRPDTIHTDLNVDILCKNFNDNAPKGVKAEKSSEAGKFVCEYTYYTSLACCGRSKTLFVHVPMKGFSYELIARGLEHILKVCLVQLGHKINGD